MKSAITCLVFLLIGFEGYSQRNSGLFQNPLSFYNTDILTYISVLYKNQEFEKMAKFFTGPAKEQYSTAVFINYLSEAPFGYTFKRAGIKEMEKGKRWNLTYQRIWLGTNEMFRISCVLERDTCRIYLTEDSRNQIFKK